MGVGFYYWRGPDDDATQFFPGVPDVALYGQRYAAGSPMRYGAKWPEYRDQWDRMVIKPSRVAEFERTADILLRHEDRYRHIESMSTVIWPMIAVIHWRESDADFNTYLGNGQSLNRPTTEVPKGRGPFATFEAGALDALKFDGLTSVKDWRLEKILYYLELYNGAGYAARHIPSPYLWGGTNIQRRGKYIRDRVWDSNVWDTQEGCAPILKTMMGKDQSIVLVRET